MEITHSTRDSCLVVALAGQITLASAPQVQRALLKDLAEQPLAVICDLGGVDALDPICASVFATVANHPTSRWPATSVLLCRAQPAVAAVLGGLRVGQFLPLYDTLQEAVDAAVDRPGFLRQELRLAPTPTAAAAARRFVRDTLQSWRLAPSDSELSDQAQLLADELVTNAAVHAQTDLRLRLEWGRELLHVAVRDLDRRLPHPLPDDPQGEGGSGLRLVEQMATTWGAQPHPGGGKVVWCTLRASAWAHGPAQKGQRSRPDRDDRGRMKPPRSAASSATAAESLDVVSRLRSLAVWWVCHVRDRAIAAGPTPDCGTRVQSGRDAAAARSPGVPGQAVLGDHLPVGSLVEARQ